MDLLTRFNQFIAKENLFQKNDRLLLAVSGGVDSVVLCELCKQAGYDFVIAHCNFQLRGDESERDELFVRSLGEKYGVQVFVKRFDTEKLAFESKQSIQVVARNLRYSWFLELIMSDEINGSVRWTDKSLPGWRVTIDKSKPHILTVTAHHANDSVETLLMNFFKGAGIRGLQGIKPKHELMSFLIRPLLFAKKEELLDFASQLNLDFVEDSSNVSDKYTRNFFRNQLIPTLKKSFPEVEANLINNLNRFSEIEVLYNQAIAVHKQNLVERKGNEVHIPVLKLHKTKPLQTILYEIIKEFGFTAHQSQDAVALLESETGRYIQSHSHRIIKNRKWLIITPRLAIGAQHILIEAEDATIHFEAGELKIEKQAAKGFKLMADSKIAQLDAASIRFPLLLRKWKQGDYFYPLGMKKKKKLSRFFIDQKLSLPQKENTWVIEMDKKIIWIVGMRIDDRVKFSATTKEVLLIQIKNAGEATA